MMNINDDGLITPAEESYDIVDGGTIDGIAMVDV
jgi:hypothetical protein